MTDLTGRNAIDAIDRASSSALRRVFAAFDKHYSTRFGDHDQIADDYQPGGDTDARLKLDEFGIEMIDSIDDAQPRADRPVASPTDDRVD